jgi:hypothetical protein
MGGAGSGKPRYIFGKDVTCDYRSIDVRHWQRDGLLTPNQSFSLQWSHDGETVASIRVRTEDNRIILKYYHRSHGGDRKNESLPVILDWTPCHYGGERPWFICPARNCGRRVAILYGGGIFACRQCYQLAYSSQRESSIDRAIRRADKIRERLDWVPGVANSKGGKPAGMHWRTFDHLLAKHDASVNESFAGMALQLGIKLDE